MDSSLLWHEIRDGIPSPIQGGMIINFFHWVILVEALVREMIHNVRKCAHHGQNSAYEYSVVIA